MPRVVGIDHLVLSVGNFARSKEFYDKLLRFLGFKRKYDYPDAAAGATARPCSGSPPPTHKVESAKGDIGFHHYAFELASRDDVDELGALLEKNAMTVLDPRAGIMGAITAPSISPIRTA